MAKARKRPRRQRAAEIAPPAEDHPLFVARQLDSVDIVAARPGEVYLPSRFLAEVAVTLHWWIGTSRIPFSDLWKFALVRDELLAQTGVLLDIAAEFQNDGTWSALALRLLRRSIKNAEIPS